MLTAHKYPHPWCTVIIRRAYGVAASAHFGPSGHVLSWPSAETGTLPVESGVAVAFGRVIAAAENPDAKRAELEAAFSEGRDPFPSAENFLCTRFDRPWGDARRALHVAWKDE